MGTSAQVSSALPRKPGARRKNRVCKLYGGGTSALGVPHRKQPPCCRLWRGLVRRGSGETRCLSQENTGGGTARRTRVQDSEPWKALSLGSERPASDAECALALQQPDLRKLLTLSVLPVLICQMQT